jgi:peptidoglycan/LPS O-acetylase OafA/YrhL
MTSPRSIRIPEPTRDPAVDLVRAGCVIAVILLHSLMVGVTVTAQGPVFENAGDSGWWLTPVSWLLQVMPLFFVIGGFSGSIALRRSRERGGDGIRFTAERLHRLLRPALVTVAVVGILLAVLARCGVPAELVATAGYRFGQPLWFLGVFLLCQALLPVMLRLHERRPLVTVSLLAGAAVLVDVIRAATGADGVGFANLVFVWLVLQQVGFFLADGRIDAMGRRTRSVVLVTAVLALVGSFVLGIHSPDLIANINPPTTALLLVGIAHTAAFSLLRTRIASFARRPRPAAFTAFVSRRTMTVYLWHMPVLLTMAGVLALWALATGSSLPAPASPEWWAGRPLWLVIVFTATAALSLPLARVEGKRIPLASPAPAVVGSAVVIALAAVLLLLVHGTTTLTAVLATAGWLLALRMVRPEAPRIAGATQEHTASALVAA